MLSQRECNEVVLKMLKEIEPEVYEGVRKTLKYYDEVYLIYEYGRWDYQVGCTIKRSYGRDYQCRIIDKSYFTYNDDELNQAREELANCQWF